MTIEPQKECNKCKELYTGPGSYCPKCRKAMDQQYNKARDKAVMKAYATRWRNVRSKHLNEFPFCSMCEDSGRTTKAVLVHHIDGNPFNNKSNNCLSLCQKCHEKIHGKDRWRKRTETKNT